MIKASVTKNSLPAILNLKPLIGFASSHYFIQRVQFLPNCFSWAFVIFIPGINWEKSLKNVRKFQRFFVVFHKPTHLQEKIG